MVLKIALGFDNNFAHHAAVTIVSILENSKSDLHFYLMHDNVSEENCQKISAMIETYGQSVDMVNMRDAFKDFFVGGWSKAMYYPIALSKICDDEKILFLDADTLVTGDLTNFYNQNLEGFYLAAAHDYGMFSSVYDTNLYKINNTKRVTIGEYFKNYLNWDKDDLKKYFNSGVLLCNLNEMRKDGIFEKMLDIIKTRELCFPDQDCFNIACHDKVKIIDNKYNYMVVNPKLWYGLSDEQKEGLADYKNEKKLPLIIHFIFKPWREFEGHRVEFAKLFWAYKKKTPWASKYDKLFFKMMRRNLFQFRLSNSDSYLRVFGFTVFEFKK